MVGGEGDRQASAATRYTDYQDGEGCEVGGVQEQGQDGGAGWWFGQISSEAPGQAQPADKDRRFIQALQPAMEWAVWAGVRSWWQGTGDVGWTQGWSCLQGLDHLGENDLLGLAPRGRQGLDEGECIAVF